MVNKISRKALQGILDKSAFGLPDSPRDAKLTAQQVKKAFYKPVVDESNSIASEINRIVDEVNSEVLQGSPSTYFLGGEYALTEMKPQAEYISMLTLNGGVYRQFPSFTSGQMSEMVVSKQNTYRMTIAFGGLNVDCRYSVKVLFEGGNDTIFEAEKVFSPLSGNDTFEVLERAVLARDILVTSLKLTVSVKVIEGSDSEISLKYGNSESKLLQNEKAITLPAEQVTTRVGGEKNLEELNGKFAKEQAKFAEEQAKKVSMQFTDSEGAANYIGMDVGTLTVTVGTHIFTNCRGNVITPDNKSKILVSNSPNLRINNSSGNRNGVIHINNNNGATQDYIKWVLPIVKYGGASAGNEYAVINLQCIRNTGTYSPVSITAAVQKIYGQDNFFSDFKGVNNSTLDPCTFTMGGEKYVGFGYKPNPSPHTVFAEGIFASSSDKVFGIHAYYNSQTQQVINAEIHSSLVWL